jgi:hypothetical protein
MLRPQLENASEGREGGGCKAAVASEQSETEVRFPEVGLDRQSGLEDGLRVGEPGRVTLDGALPGGLEGAL